MEHLNFYDQSLHEIIKQQGAPLKIRIFPNEDPNASPYENAKFAIGEHIITADTTPACLIHYLLEPMLAHYPHVVTIDDRPIERRPFVPKVEHSYNLMPHPLEGQYAKRKPDFSYHVDAGIMIDGVTYAPHHACWEYQTVDPNPRHPHWSRLADITAYPFVDLGNPANTDPFHPQNIAETMSHTMKPEYQVPGWKNRENTPDPESVYQSWAPKTSHQVAWLLPSLPVVVNGTPAIIDVKSTSLAFTIAHALFNQPELGLVPVMDSKPEVHHVTVTCKDGEQIVITDKNGVQHSILSQLPGPNGTVESISIQCRADGQQVDVKPDFLFLSEDDQGPERIYATGKHHKIDVGRKDDDQITRMAANAFVNNQLYPGPPADRCHQVRQALHSTHEALHAMMMTKIDELDQLRKSLTPVTEPAQAQDGPWTINHNPSSPSENIQ